MAFATTRPSGEAVELLLPVEDPGLSEISGKPETLTEDVDLRNVIRDLSVLHKSNVVLLWAYKAPRRAAPHELEGRLRDHPAAKVDGTDS
jgi:hypothetical protein